MNIFIVLIVIGNDKPGLVEAISQIVVDHQGNWLESRMSRLAGKFAGILKVSVSLDNADDLIAAFIQLETQGLKVVAEKSSSTIDDGPEKTLKLTILGNDRLGIINEVSQVLASNNINVDELVSDCRSAPMTGELLFDAKIEIRIPEDADIEKVSNDLEQISNELIVDITLE